jgi:DNA-binding NtrC family response regulator/tetratricopeptide (TPR) repeat protein
LLEGEGNVWLNAVAHNDLVASCIIDSDVDSGIRAAEISVSLSDASGVATVRRACLGNLGNLYYIAGQFDKAAEHIRRADEILPSRSERSNGALDNLARVYLRQGRLTEARECLRRVEQSIRTERDWSLYANRQSRLTLTEVLLREGRHEEGLKSVEIVENLAKRAGDHLLLTSASVLKAHFLLRCGATDELTRVLSNLIDRLPQHPPELFAHYERVLAAALVSTGHQEDARAHFDRAKRLYAGLHNVPGQIELERTWEEALASAPDPVDPRSQAQPTIRVEGIRSAGNLLQNVAALMMHAGRPELLATGIVEILRDTGAVSSATAISRGDDGSEQVLGAFDQPREHGRTSAEPPRTIRIGPARNRSVEVVLQPHADIESIATLNAVTLLLGTIRDLERAHAEREEQQTLWPIEELPADGDQAVVGGCLHELLTFARRVARTNVSVLITGESGTGKEILARAIHGYSARADKPFVPFNCTAVPREMLESQLFGYRRGSFTGADRDNPGLIRAARGGTLFLDEIGELSIELQPKLLRFLESGEISPLGESPLNVDVRVVAATNRNLEDLVQADRFREDLYYRLNVIRLTIPPLRERRDEIPALVHHFVQRGASEFSKGRVRVAEETMEHLLLYAWPGNIRQLHNELRRMIAIADVDAVLRPSALSQEIRRAMAKGATRASSLELAVSLEEKLTPTLSRIEREMIRVALRTHQGRVEAAAKALGISRKGLYLKRQRLGL